MLDLQLGDIIKTRKPHPCGCDTWVIIRVGADIKIKCQKCAHIVMMDRAAFEKRYKTLVSRPDPAEGPSSDPS